MVFFIAINISFEIKQPLKRIAKTSLPVLIKQTVICFSVWTLMCWWQTDGKTRVWMVWLGYWFVWHYLLDCLQQTTLVNLSNLNCVLDFFSVDVKANIEELTYTFYVHLQIKQSSTIKVNKNHNWITFMQVVTRIFNKDWILAFNYTQKLKLFFIVGT